LGLQFTGRKFYQVLEMVKKLVTGQWSPKFLGGPVAIATIAGREANQGATRLLLFLTFLSVNLAILNFMPIPALDGGHMVFLTIEGITGKPVKESVQVALTMIGVMLLLTMIVLVTFNDIVRTVQALWRGQADDAYGQAAVIKTVAAVLWGLEKVTSLEEGEKAAAALWEARHRDRL
jgi:regulator of sigma E protease